MNPDDQKPTFNLKYNDEISCPRCKAKSYYPKKKHVARLIKCNRCGYKATQ